MVKDYLFQSNFGHRGFRERNVAWQRFYSATKQEGARELLKNLKGWEKPAHICSL